MNRRLIGKLAVAMMVTTATAFAQSKPAEEPAPTYTCHTTVELPLLALAPNALALAAERPVAPRTSVMAVLALRDGADGDFQSTTFALGSELRFWLRSEHRRWFVAPRVEFALTHVSASNPQRSLGNAVIGTAGIVIGYRFLLRQHLTIVPEIGIAGRADLVSRVPDRATLTPQFGVAIGWRFQGAE